MADYSLVVNSTYNPFTFQELMQPAVLATQAHQQLEDAYGELDTTASVWENKANQQTDERTYKQYKNYADSLKAQAAQLAAQGLNPNSKQSLLNMKARYASEIIPIEQAYQRRQKLADEQRQGRAKGLIYDYDAATTSLDKFVFDNQKDYSTIDLNTLYSKSKDAFGNIARELSKYGKGKPVDAYTNTFIQQHGITREQAARFADDIRAGRIDQSNPALRAIYNSLYSSTGVDAWNNKQAEGQVMNTILSGVNSAIGQSNINTLDNYGARLAAQEAKERRTALYQHSLSNPDPNIHINKYLKRNSSSIKEKEAFDKNWDVIKQYMYKDAKGNWRMNYAGRKRYAEGVNSTPIPNTSGGAAGPLSQQVYHKDSAFVSAVKALELQGLATGKWGPYQQSKLDRNTTTSSTPYDANKYTEYYRAISDSDKDLLLRALQRAGRGGGTPTADWVTDKKTGQTLKFGKNVDFSKLESKDIKDAITVVGKEGNYYEVTLSDNSIIRVPIKSVFGSFNSRVVDMENAKGFLNYYETDRNDAINYDIDNAISSFGTTEVENRKLNQQ